MKTLESALQIFRTSGDFEECFVALGVDRGRRPQLALQQALTRASTRKERDTLEDISFVYDREESLSLPSQEKVTEIQKCAEDTYGPYLTRFIEIVPLVNGIYRTTETPPPLEAVVAVIGIVVARAVEWTLPVKPEDYAQTVSYWKTDCNRCHGKGVICCPNCLARARSMTAQMRRQFHVPLDWDDERFARELLRQQKQLFGCSACHNTPAQSCECVREISIPQHPKDGEVLRGKYSRSGKEIFCCIRLQD